MNPYFFGTYFLIPEKISMQSNHIIFNCLNFIVIEFYGNNCLKHCNNGFKSGGSPNSYGLKWLQQPWVEMTNFLLLSYINSIFDKFYIFKGDLNYYVLCISSNEWRWKTRTHQTYSIRDGITFKMYTIQHQFGWSDALILSKLTHRFKSSIVTKNTQ